MASLTRLADRPAADAAAERLLAAAPGYTVSGDAATRTALLAPALFDSLREAGLPE